MPNHTVQLFFSKVLGKPNLLILEVPSLVVVESRLIPQHLYNETTLSVDCDFIHILCTYKYILSCMLKYKPQNFPFSFKND